MSQKLKEPKESKVTPSTEKKAKSELKINKTIIAKCDCINEYQDKLYGKGLRAKNSKGTGFRCTVCGKV